MSGRCVTGAALAIAIAVRACHLAAPAYRRAACEDVHLARSLVVVNLEVRRIELSDSAEQVGSAIEEAGPGSSGGDVADRNWYVGQAGHLANPGEIDIEGLEPTDHVVVHDGVHQVEVLGTPVGIHRDRRLGFQGGHELLQCDRSVRAWRLPKRPSDLGSEPQFRGVCDLVHVGGLDAPNRVPHEGEPEGVAAQHPREMLDSNVTPGSRQCVLAVDVPDRREPVIAGVDPMQP